MTKSSFVIHNTIPYTLYHRDSRSGTLTLYSDQCKWNDIQIIFVINTAALHFRGESAAIFSFGKTSILKKFPHIQGRRIKTLKLSLNYHSIGNGPEFDQLYNQKHFWVCSSKMLNHTVWFIRNQRVNANLCQSPICDVDVIQSTNDQWKEFKCRSVSALLTTSAIVIAPSHLRNFRLNII